MSPELVSALFGGLALLVGALATYTANRGRRAVEVQQVRKDYIRRLRKRDEAAVAYIYRLRRELLERGFPAPALPPILEDDDDHDVTGAAPGPSQPPGVAGAPGDVG